MTKARIDTGYGAHRHSVFLRTPRIRLNAARVTNQQEIPMLVHETLEKGRSLAERIPTSVIALASRIAVADVFWRSGQTKLNGFSIREETFYLFREEYKVPLLPPDLAAYLSTIGEHVFPILLFFGFASRLSALGLFGMTLVIQLFVVPCGWPEHILWFSLLTLIIARGPGAVSLDHLIWNKRLSMPAIAHRARA